MSRASSVTPKPSSSFEPSYQSVTCEYHVGPIVSWPFFGSNRGELSHPKELNRGPWSTTESYLLSCAEREINGVIWENEGKSAPHRLHLDPDEIISSRHHRLRAVPGDESDESDEWDLEESEDEWEGPGDAMYRDYRRMQRSTFLIAHMKQREEAVRKEMRRWMNVMDLLVKEVKKPDGNDEFGLDCHDLSLENVFVDEKDNVTIVSIFSAILPSPLLFLNRPHSGRRVSLIGRVPQLDPSGHAPTCLLFFRVAHFCQNCSGTLSPNYHLIPLSTSNFLK